jgi:site-specific DNA-methyltransferase (adenine-specific)/site-specific DNA-methyltransferase (cytosine-N4-specific)
MGSGTTIFVANKMKRNAIGIEIVPEYYDIIVNVNLYENKRH